MRHAGKRRRFGLLAAGVLMLAAGGAGAAEATSATLRALDKVTTRITDIDLKVGETATFGALTIRLERCVVAEGEGAKARLAIDYRTAQGETKRVFDGWMFSEMPALNPLEHPTYDVWVASCSTS
ncbi:DUF2155 domain-containing protein [Futiania mangrovi]|uniref:DUF2155 domain-containing protein n=1 Tax=Futiania mangrovi TaxID=2959716 RepID=A0A9J6PHW8_9PROT|nr:DUF2155 domain-containing protein [Futiania mangrovii]MCP1335674.1 DUF2155 domain-containing protein [Futiania mangrovii]